MEKNISKLVESVKQSSGRWYENLPPEVEKFLEKANFQTTNYVEGRSKGLAGDEERWMGFFCKKMI